MKVILANKQEMEKMTKVSHLSSFDQMMKGHKQLYDRLEEAINNELEREEVSNVLESIRVR